MSLTRPPRTPHQSTRPPRAAGRLDGGRLPRRHGMAERWARRRWVVPGLLLVAGLALGTAGFLLVLAARAPAPAVRMVVVTMHHTHFQPAEIRVDAGTTVRFALRNTDPIDHEFIVGDAAVQARHEVGRERHHHGDIPGEISVPAGTERRTTFRFPGPGSMEFACHLPGHYAYGMHGLVRIRP